MRTVVLSLLLALTAQEPPPRDPTEADARMRQALLQSRGPAAPGVILRGLVVAKGRPGAAVVETEGRLVRVEAGSTFPGVRVVGVAADGVSLEIQATGQIVVLR